MQVYHPNIDLDGNVCLNILREDWKPVLSINSIIYGLQYLLAVRPHVFCIGGGFESRTWKRRNGDVAQQHLTSGCLVSCVSRVDTGVSWMDQH